MRLIEQAAERLEALQRSGVVMPWMQVPDDGAVASTDVPSHSYLTSVAANPFATRPLRRVELDLERLQAEGTVFDMQARTALAETFRRIKRPLLRNLRIASSKGTTRSLIMVTSALPGEGKTFCALHLALSLSMEVGLRIVLVDADVVHPQLLTRLGLDASAPGLLDLLRDDQLTLPEVLLQTSLESLVLLPAGGSHALSTEWLAAPAMGRLLHGLSAESGSQLVLFDGPPLLVTTEAAVLAAEMGQVLVVVEAGRTPTAAVTQGFELLAEHPLVMAVLNKSPRPTPEGDGYHDSSYYIRDA